MSASGPRSASTSTPRRLPREQRRVQLLETARRIVREEGADRLTLGHLALRAGVSKPVVYDHFATPTVLLIDLYQWIDMERVDAFRHAMAAERHDADGTITLLAATYIDCAAETDGDFHAVGGALAGSPEKDAVFQKLLAYCVAMFVAVLEPHSTLAPEELQRRCVALVGAGEALAVSLVRKACGRDEAVSTFAALIRGVLQMP